MRTTGRVWCFGDDINTDLIEPSSAVLLSTAEKARHCFEANRPGWVDLVEPGDLVVAGRNFGTGSSRPAALTLRAAGIAGIIAESVNGLFFRNCVNFAVPALSCPGITGAVTEGDVVSFDPADGSVRNDTTGATLRGRAWAPELIDILDAGGLIRQLESEGLLLEAP
ncbi:hypothetical protein [Actinomadura chibensis]|uniref:3-isopropylmalate dehydratase small subunit n=1 Tax=Actinomadura chibensis TaxID=392828 RepID=A0A5D0NUC9_9ACTN|nr:hypothetical protein [Actinomadura chibensis]TYB47842.1 3-isopropylmalate dehydratase [Actinomadura chibensis]